MPREGCEKTQDGRNGESRGVSAIYHHTQQVPERIYRIMCFSVLLFSGQGNPFPSKQVTGPIVPGR